MEFSLFHVTIWQLVQLQLVAFVTITLAWFARIKYRPGLRKLPGPLLASFSYLDQVWSAAKGLQMNYHLQLHSKYGPVVRVGPNHVSLSDVNLIPKIYGTTTKFSKSDFYRLFDVGAPGRVEPSIFSVRDEGVHRQLKRPAAHAYSMSVLKELEPANDECSAILVRKLNALVDHDIDLGAWLHWYAFDVIFSITFSERLDFMEQEKDVKNIITAIERRLMYASVIGQIPWVDKYLLGNSCVSWLGSFIPPIALIDAAGYIIELTAQQIAHHDNRKPGAGAGEEAEGSHRDLLSQFKRRRRSADEPAMDPDKLLSATYANIFAGADTTAATLRAIFYFLCRTPRAYAALQRELDAAHRHGSLSDPPTFDQAQALPYLQAVVKEALRMHPAVGFLLERVVPAGGTELGPGRFVPGGTVVGINPWVAARDRSVYGPDADEFRPERWLGVDDDEATWREMERCSLAFGAGSRTCLGKNISILEISKIVPLLLLKFEFELADPGREWTLHDYWFVKQTGLICRVRSRGEER